MPGGCDEHRPVILAAPALAAAVVACTVDPFVLANAEHALGFLLGAVVAREPAVGSSCGLGSDAVVGDRRGDRLPV